MGDMNLKLVLELDDRGAIKGIRDVDGSLVRLGGDGGRAGAEIAGGMSKARRGVESISDQLSRMRREIIGIVGLHFGVQMVRDLAGVADSYKSVTARLQVASRSAAEAAVAYRELGDIARSTRADWGSTVDLYSRLARSTKELGVSQRDLLTVTKAINQAIVVSGASAIEANNALIQLGQGLASGTLRGDELRSVLEQMPRLAEMIAKGMGKSIGDLRKLGEEGALTTEQVIHAIKKQASVVDQEFRRMPPTIAQALTQISNAWTTMLGEADRASGSSTRLAEALMLVADNMRTLGNAAIGLAIALGKIGMAYGALHLAAMVQGLSAATVATRNLRAATLGLMMLYQTGGLAAVLRQPFIDMGLATKSALSGVSKLTLAGHALFAAYAGWEIGTYLSEQFDVVRQVGVALVTGLLKGWEKIKYGFNVMIESVRHAWDSAIAGLKRTFGAWLTDVGKAIGRLPFASGMGSQVAAFGAQLQKAQGPVQQLKEKLDELRAARDAALAGIDKIGFDLFQGQQPGDQPGIPPPPPPMSPGIGGGSTNTALQDLLKDAERLSRQMDQAFMSMEERVTNRYVDMYMKLVAAGGEGTDQLKALTASYNEWLTSYLAQQQEQERQQYLEHLQMKLDTLSNALMTETERENQAYENRRQMLEDALNNKLITEQRYRDLLERLEEQHQAKLTELQRQGEEQRLQQRMDFANQAMTLQQQVGQMFIDASRINIGQLTVQLKSFLDSSKELWKKGMQGKLSVVQGGLSMLSGLMESHNRRMFEAGKVAAIANAVISTAQGMAEALKWGWPMGPIFAGIIGAAGALQIAKIASTQFGQKGAGSAGIPASGVGGGTPAVPINPRTGFPQAPSEPAKPSPQQIHLTFVNPIMTEQFVAEQVAPTLQDMMENKDVTLFGPNSAQARLAAGG